MPEIDFFQRKAISYLVTLFTFTDQIVWFRYFRPNFLYRECTRSRNILLLTVFE